MSCEFCNTKKRGIEIVILEEVEEKKKMGAEEPLRWRLLTFAQILAALTMGKRESAFGLTVTSIPGNRLESFSSYFSAGPTVST